LSNNNDDSEVGKHIAEIKSLMSDTRIMSDELSVTGLTLTSSINHEEAARQMRLHYSPNGKLCDSEIIALCQGDTPMITPLLKGGKSAPGTISSGVTSFGYDARLGTKFKRVQSNKHVLIDPKNIPPDLFEDFEVSADWNQIADDTPIYTQTPIYVPPHSYLLGVSYEKFNIPKNVSAICVGKSTYARCGLLINVTPLEAGWSGHITIEIANLESIPIRIYPMEGIMQVEFHSRNIEPIYDYSARKGKYQNQEAVPVAPR